MLAKLAAFGFAIVEALLLVRLVLPYVHWPATLNDWIPKLIDVTDLLVAPFKSIFGVFDLRSNLSGVSGGVLSSYVDKLDAGVLVAMIGWAVIAVFVTLILSLVARAR